MADSASTGSSGRLSRHASTIRMQVNRGNGGSATSTTGTSGMVLVDDLAASELVAYLETRLLGFVAFFALGMMANSWYQRRKRMAAENGPGPSRAKFYAVRFTPGTEIKQALEEFVKQHNIRAGAIVSCVGSTQPKAKIRLANASAKEAGTLLETETRCEIVSLSGTVSENGMHIHIALGDEQGHVTGGHLVNATVNTTCEIVLAELKHMEFQRTMDPATGFRELDVRRI